MASKMQHTYAAAFKSGYNSIKDVIASMDGNVLKHYIGMDKIEPAYPKIVAVR